MKNRRVLFTLVLAAVLLTTLVAIPAFAGSLPPYAELRAALKSVVVEKNGGFGLNMWATVVDRDGVVKLVVFSGEKRGDQWPGSRVISAQKANTANAFSLPSLALSTANLFSAVQPGGSLYGLQFSNPVDTTAAYRGPSKAFGTENDPMVGRKIGGVNVFGGGLPLYDSAGNLIGAIGVSGDSSCADHNIAWKVRHILKIDYVPSGVSPTKDDNIVNDIIDGKSISGWGHPICSDEAAKIAKEFSNSHPIRSKK
ncbi:MAG: heme-binding protein [Syntrophales bacterium]|nr:heme-binding protein [Syntrophales bacterium]